MILTIIVEIQHLFNQALPTAEVLIIIGVRHRHHHLLRTLRRQAAVRQGVRLRQVLRAVVPPHQAVGVRHLEVLHREDNL